MMVSPAENPHCGFGIDIEPKQGQASEHSDQNYSPTISHITPPSPLGYQKTTD
jgi:hypothetical protein